MTPTCKHGRYLSCEACRAYQAPPRYVAPPKVAKGEPHPDGNRRKRREAAARERSAKR